MITVAIAIYKLNLPNRPYDDVFAKIDRFSRYMASNYGLIFDTKNNKLVSQFKYRDENQNKTKYYYKVNVVDDYGKKHCARVNRLVLMAFQPLEDYSSVESNHKNLDTENNCLYNLEWTTHLENVQHYCKSINSNIIYTDEMVHGICRCLCQSMPYEDIAKIVFNSELTEPLKAYICAIRGGNIRKDISSQYNFPNKKRNNALFTDDQIHFICKCIVNGDSSSDILSKLGIDLPRGSKERLNVLEIIRRIRSKERFTRISNLYF